MVLSIALPISRFLTSSSRTFFGARASISNMGAESTSLMTERKRANLRLINVSGYKTDLLEIHSLDPTLHVLLIPGNPGVVSFYTEFLESLFELLGGTVSITGIGHISHTEKNWESGRLFSLQEQIEHKVTFVEHVLQDTVPIVLVGHSIGSYISLEILRSCPKKVLYCIGLYPFLTVNNVSSEQAFIKRIAGSSTISAALSFIGAFFGMFPVRISSLLAKNLVGKSCSSSTVEILRAHVLQYHTLRNVLFMANTEFDKLVEKPDWDFIEGKKCQIAFLFGLDDHWGPLHLYDEIREKVPGSTLTLETEGHTHAFCCTKAGSTWVAQHVSSLIKNHLAGKETILSN